MLGYIGVPLDETLDADGFFHTRRRRLSSTSRSLCWEGRLTGIIKTGGANVSPPEVDEAIASCIRDVKSAETVGVPHEDARRDGRCLRGAARGRRCSTRTRSAMFLKERLASYKVPRRVLFFQERGFADRQRQGEIGAAARSRDEKAEQRELALLSLRLRRRNWGGRTRPSKATITADTSVSARSSGPDRSMKQSFSAVPAVPGATPPELSPPASGKMMPPAKFVAEQFEASSSSVMFLPIMAISQRSSTPFNAMPTST